MSYAGKTRVPIHRSKIEIEKLLIKYGCESFGYMTRNGIAQLAFEYNGKPFRISLPLPNIHDKEFTETDTGRERAQHLVYRAWEQGCRARWRALLLVIKAKLEYLEITNEPFYKSFAENLILPTGQTLNEFYLEKATRALSSGMKMPPLLREPKNEA